MKTPAPFLVACGALSSFAAAPALAQQAPADGQDRIEGLRAADLFDLAGAAERAGRIEDAETLYRGLTLDSSVEIRSEARFRLAQLYLRLDRLTDAAVQFRAILDEQPDAQRVRLELAAVLARLGKLDDARRQLRQAQAGALPPEVAQAVDQFAAALRSRKPFGASIELALVPDSNINRATDAQTLDTIIAPLELSRDARARAGIAARASGQAYARVALADRLALVPRISARGEFHRESQFDDASGSAQLGLEWSPGSDRFQLSGGATMRWYGGKPYARTETASLDWRHPLDRRTQLSAGATIARTDYRLNPLQDGMLYNAELGIERAFSPRAGGSVEVSVTRQSARDPGYANVATGTTLLAWREFGRSTAFASASVRRLFADERLFLYPSVRRDTLLGGTLGVTLRTFTVKGFAPVIRVTYERNFSTVGIYDYRRIATSFGITRAF